MGAAPAVAKNRYALVDALRGFIALWILLYHLSEGGHIPTLMAAIPEWAKTSAFDGGLSERVGIFFVISGIVMARITSRAPMTTENASKFLARRIVRLAPPYYAAVVLGFMVIAVKVWRGESGVTLPRSTDVLAHLGFAQEIFGVENIVTVFWTIGIEVQLYIALALLLWVADRISGDRSQRVRNIVIWSSAAIALLWPLGVVESVGWRGGFLGVWFSFMIGVLCFMALDGSARDRYVALGYGSLLVFIGVVTNNGFSFATGLTGVGFVLLVRRAASSRFINSYPVQKIGLISYSLYLFHVLVTGIFMRAYRSVFPSSMGADLLATALVLAACIAFAAVMYFVFERPAIAWSRKITMKRSE